MPLRISFQLNRYYVEVRRVYEKCLSNYNQVLPDLLSVLIKKFQRPLMLVLCFALKKKDSLIN